MYFPSFISWLPCYFADVVGQILYLLPCFLVVLSDTIVPQEAILPLLEMKSPPYPLYFPLYRKAHPIRWGTDFIHLSSFGSTNVSP